MGVEGSRYFDYRGAPTFWVFTDPPYVRLHGWFPFQIFGLSDEDEQRLMHG